MKTALSHCTFQGAVRLGVTELEKHNPFSSCFSLGIPAPVTAVEGGERVYCFKADTTLGRLHDVKFLAS